jgi:hypothetical protein
VEFDTFLLCFAMQRVLAAARAILIKLQTPRVIPAVFLGCIISVFALGASQSDHRTNIFLRSHTNSPGAVLL